MPDENNVTPIRSVEASEIAEAHLRNERLHKEKAIHLAEYYRLTKDYDALEDEKENQEKKHRAEQSALRDEVAELRNQIADLNQKFLDATQENNRKSSRISSIERALSRTRSIQSRQIKRLARRTVWLPILMAAIGVAVGAAVRLFG